MTTPPPSRHGGWNQPPAGADWASPGGYQPTRIGQPHGDGGYGEQSRPPSGYDQGDSYGQQQPYGPSGHGPGGYPAPGYPQPTAPKPGTNGMAITALIFGIIGGALLGIIFGLIALSQIKKSGQGGRGLAITGLVLSGLWIVLGVAVVAVALATTAKRDSTGTVTQGGDVSATALQVGDCVNNLKTTTNLRSLPAVPCAQAHEGEVFAVFDLPAGPYPGAAAVDKSVNEECSARFSAYAPNPTDPDPGLVLVYPLQENWEQGDRGVACIVTPGAGGTSTGSIKGS